MTKPTRIIIANARAGTYEKNCEVLSHRLMDSALPFEYLQVDISRADLETHVRRLVETRDVDALIGMGGDGTVCRTLAMILKYKWGVKLGIIPAGTGNLLAAALGIPLDCDLALDILQTGQVTWANAGKMSSNGKSYYFTLNAGAGLDAEVIANTPVEDKKALGLLAYLAEMCRRLFRIRYKRFAITADGKTMHFNATGVLVISHRNFLSRFNPLYNPAAENNMDNGLFDVCVFKTETPADYMHAFADLLSRKYMDPSYQSEVMRHFEARKVTIHSWPKALVQADGELVGKTPVTFEYIPRAVQVIVPAATLGEDPGQSKATGIASSRY